MHNNHNNRDYSSDYNRTNKIYNLCIPSLERLMPVCTNTTDLHKLLQHTRASVIKHSLYSTTWIYWAVFKQKYDVIVIESTYTVLLRIIYNRHSARLMHDHVTVISFTLITIVVHQNLCLVVCHWLLLSSREQLFEYHTAVLSRRSVCITHDEKCLLLRNTEYVERWNCYLFIAYIFFYIT